MRLTKHEKVDQLVDFINGARYKSGKNGLENMRRLLDNLGNPQNSYPCCHIAGTNGKGSVCAMTESVLRANGYKTGLYTSPYLCHYTERIQINGVPVDEDTFITCGERVKSEAERLTKEDIFCTAFELGTALAFLVFQEAHVDFAVIETGLGGRLDSTNLIHPIACAITTIGMDHMAILGDTPEKIAYEKAGIIKENTPVALYPQTSASIEQVFLDTCKERCAPLTQAKDMPLTGISCNAHGASFDVVSPVFGQLSLQIRLPGRHQVENARTAVALLGLLHENGFPIDKEKLLSGITNTQWAGRLEWIRPNILLDGAHNPEGAQKLAQFVKSNLSGRPITLITGMMKDKQPETCANIFKQIANRVIATKVDWARAMEEAELAALYDDIPVTSCATPMEALAKARNTLPENGIILVCGSLYLVGDIRNILKEEA